MARVLVVDDDDGTREWLAEVLEGAGHRVLTARDGLEARALAMNQTLEVVITDISMPNEEGLGLLQALRRTCKELKVVVISGHDADSLHDAILLGAHAALRKPVQAKAILECVKVLSHTLSAQA
ncbi:MAG TPA: response regulator [Bryobacteraceae bacterium]|nr:response regulator [Bryobacteraceae bacterium]